MRVVITRDLSTDSDEGIRGRLSIPELGFECDTLELPWRGNANDVSRIKPGVYPARVYKGKRPYLVYMLDDVEGRFAVQMHIGNFAGDVTKGLRSDVEGCILLGSGFGILNGQLAVLRSGKTFKAFMAATEGADLEIEIVEA